MHHKIHITEFKFGAWIKPYDLGICIVSNLFSVLFHFIHLSNKSIGSLSSHSNFPCKSSWITNFALRNAGLTIPNESKTELTQLTKPRLVPSNSFKSDWTVIWADFGSHYT